MGILSSPKNIDDCYIEGPVKEEHVSLIQTFSHFFFKFVTNKITRLECSALSQRSSFSEELNSSFKISSAPFLHVGATLLDLHSMFSTERPSSFKTVEV